MSQYGVSGRCRDKNKIFDCKKVGNKRENIDRYGGIILKLIEHSVIYLNKRKEIANKIEKQNM